MKLLIITQKVDRNDSYFGFFHDWLIRFAKNCEKVTVISLETYEYQLPVNVKVLSLGKEKKVGRLGYLWLLLKYSIGKRKEYDAVFCHMSPLYVISGWLVWRLFNKKIALWYVHRSVDLKLRIAHLLSDIVFTATKESYGISSNKVKYMGQAIDIDRFVNPNQGSIMSDTPLKIITVGRITPIKRLEALIEAVAIVRSKNIPVHVDIVGPSTLYSDADYEGMLKGLIKSKNLEGEISFIGSVPNKDLPKYYWNHNLFVNLSPTGGLDKAVLEAMASGIPVIVSNRAFEQHLDGFVDDLLCNNNDPEDCALKIISLYRNKNYKKIGESLGHEVKRRSSLDALIVSIVRNIDELSK